MTRFELRTTSVRVTSTMPSGTAKSSPRPCDVSDSRLWIYQCIIHRGATQRTHTQRQLAQIHWKVFNCSCSAHVR